MPFFPSGAPRDTFEGAEEEFRRSLRVRVMHPATAAPEQLRDSIDGPADLRLRVVIDSPETVRYYTLADLQPLGDPGQLLARAVANMREPIKVHGGTLPYWPDETTVAPMCFLVSDETLFASARVLQLDELLPDIATRMGAAPWAYLVAVPYAQVLEVVPLLDQSAEQPVGAFRRFVTGGYQGSPDRLSPHVYLVRDGEFSIVPA